MESWRPSWPRGGSDRGAGDDATAVEFTFFTCYCSANGDFGFELKPHRGRLLWIKEREVSCVWLF